MKSYAVAPEGIFAVYLDQKVEQDIVATYETQGRAAAVKKVYHSIESIHLEDIFAILEGTLECTVLSRAIIAKKITRVSTNWNTFRISSFLTLFYSDLRQYTFS